MELNDVVKYFTILSITLEEFYSKGGLNFVSKYYYKRYKLYSLSRELAPFAIYGIIRLAIRAKEYPQFQKLVTHFNKETLVSQLRESWLLVIADFYVKNGKKQNAIDFYELIVKAYPASKRAQKRAE